MKKPPTVQEIRVPQTDTTTETALAPLDKFPLAQLELQGKDSEIMLLGGAPILFILILFTTVIVIRIARHLKSRNELGLIMRVNDAE